MTFKEKWNMKYPDRPYQPGNLGPGCVLGYFPNAGLDIACTIATDCATCWDREIPGTEIKKENDIMPVNAIHTREVTKEDLLREIKAANEHIHQMETQIKNLERYKQYEDMANEFKAVHTAFMNSGFTNDQAYDLLKTAIQVITPSVLRGMGV